MADDTSYEAVTCAVCYRVHLVNPNSGRVAGVLTKALSYGSPDRAVMWDDLAQVAA
jgi:hypothetical protein